MKDSDSFLFGLFIGCICGILILYLVIDSPKDIRKEAIQAGVAHWAINPTTGEKKFVFECEPD